MDDKLFVPYLKELADKYSAAENLQVELKPGKVDVSCNKGSFSFVYDFSQLDENDASVVPMLHWRNKRRYIELKNILKTKMVEDPRGMRIHHIVPKSDFDCSLENILCFEADIIEFITGQKVTKIFADFSGDVYTNCIAYCNEKLVASLELGFSPEGSEPVLLHEVIARTGIASDVAVDTQMQQYPIYVIKGKELEHYNEIDNELYGLDNTQADCIRFILAVLTNPDVIPELQKQGSHLVAVYKAAEKATKVLEYAEVEC